MPFIKVCPKCGLVYGLSAEYCLMLHCPFCGNAVCERGVGEIIAPWIGFAFMCVFVSYWFVVSPPNKWYDFVGIGLLLLIFGGLCFYFSNPKQKYRCSRCNKFVTSPVGHLSLVEPSLRCHKCGMEMHTMERFCGYCGAELF